MQSALIMDEIGESRYQGLAIGKVAKIYSQANMVDALLFDGTLIRRVQLLSQSCSSKTGTIEMPVSEYETPLMKQRIPCVNCKNPNESDVFVVIAFLGSGLKRPIALGFLYPEENEILCDTNQPGNSDGSMRLWKHKSNTYTMVRDNGDIEISHPSGVFIKVGATTERTDVYNYDRKVRPFQWKDPSTGELSPAPYVSIQHPSGNYFIIDPEGNVSEMVVGDKDVTIKGNLTETIEGDVNRKISGDVSETCDGDWTKDVSGTLKDNGNEIQHNE